MKYSIAHPSVLIETAFVFDFKSIFNNFCIESTLSSTIFADILKSKKVL